MSDTITFKFVCLFSALMFLYISCMNDIGFIMGYFVPDQQSDVSKEEVHGDSFFTSNSSWSVRQVNEYEFSHTPEKDPSHLYHARCKEQAIAELQNQEEIVKYISNVADIVPTTAPYQLLIRVLLSDQSMLAQTKQRWDAILEYFSVPSSLIKVKVDFFAPVSESIVNRLFEPGKDGTDWVFVVEELTYVHLSRLVRRLFSDCDPTTSVRQGLLVPLKKDGSNQSLSQNMVPLPEAGILFSQSALVEVSDSPQTSKCWLLDSIYSWSACLVEASFEFAGLPGLNPHSISDLMKSSLEGSLFASKSQMYQSVGGPVLGTSRLPMTYGKMPDNLFYDQLVVDTNQAKIPRILHHIWSGPTSEIPDVVRRAAKQCKQMHEEQGWEYMFWDDTKLQGLPGLPQLPPWLKTKRVREYSDILRYFLLHQFGGVYVDVDAFCIRTFDPLLDYTEHKGRDFLVNYESERYRGRQIANGIIISAPKSPVLSAIILHLGKRLSMATTGWETEVAAKATGPWCVTEVRERWESWVQSHIVVFPSSAFIPLHRVEGKDLTLNDAFSKARAQGSYTIQMYHAGALASLINAADKGNIEEDKRKSGAIVGVDVRDQGAGALSAPQPSVLMIVAHPDDEILWGGEYLLSEERNNVQVVVACTMNKNTATRLREFRSVERHVGFRGEFLNGTDSPRSKGLEYHITDHIQKLVCNRDWEKIITHGPEGEYGHPQHQQVFDAVMDAISFCCHSADRLFVFQPHPSTKPAFSDQKAEAATLYTSQKKIIFRHFGHWLERIVPLHEYDYKTASSDCRASAATRNNTSTRKCRLHKMIGDFSARSSHEINSTFMSQVSFEGQGSDC